MADLPSGTVTFLFTDIEGSTPLWEQHPEAMSRAVSRHHTSIYRKIGVNSRGAATRYALDHKIV